MEFDNGYSIDLGTRYLKTDKEQYILSGSPYASKVVYSNGAAHRGTILTESSLNIMTEDLDDLLQG